MIKAVIFDIDGTLMDSFQANVDFYQRLMVAAGYKKPTKAEFKDGIWRTSWDEIKHLSRSDNDAELRRILLIGLSVPINESLYKKQKGIKAVLGGLKKRYRLGIVTNRSKESAKIALNFLGLKEMIRTVITSSDVLYGKPNPEGINLVLKKLKVNPQQAVFVGDSLSDAQAAAAAGVNFVTFGKRSLIKGGLKTNKFVDLPKLIATYEYLQ